MKRVLSVLMSTENSSNLMKMVKEENFSDILDYLAMEARHYARETKNNGYSLISNFLDKARNEVISAEVDNNISWDDRK